MRRWKCSLQIGTCSGDANRKTLPTANKYLFANLLLLTSREGDEATPLSFETTNALIDPPHALLKVLVIAYYMQGGWEMEHFPKGKQILLENILFFYEQGGP